MKALACSRSGHTLVELMVVSTILALVATLATKAWKPLGQLMIGQRVRVVADAELRMAVSWIRQDVGAARKLKPREGGGLRIEVDPAAIPLDRRGTAGGTPVIEYRLDHDLLLRRDRMHAGEIVVARECSLFEVRRQPDFGTSLRISCGSGEDALSVELIWRGPS